MYFAHVCKYENCDDYGRKWFCTHPKHKNKGIWKFLFSEQQGCTETGKMPSRYKCPDMVERIVPRPPAPPAINKCNREGS